jgi:hypothetical protein
LGFDRDALSSVKSLNKSHKFWHLRPPDRPPQQQFWMRRYSLDPFDYGASFCANEAFDKDTQSRRLPP